MVLTDFSAEPIINDEQKVSLFKIREKTGNSLAFLVIVVVLINVLKALYTNLKPVYQYAKEKYQNNKQ